MITSWRGVAGLGTARHGAVWCGVIRSAWVRQAEEVIHA